MTCSKVHQGTVGACVYCERDALAARLAEKEAALRQAEEAIEKMRESWVPLQARRAEAERLLRESADCLRVNRGLWAGQLADRIDAFTHHDGDVARAAVDVLQRFRDDPVVHAQNMNGSDVWRGPRSMMPAGYAEVVTEEEYRKQMKERR